LEDDPSNPELILTARGTGYSNEVLSQGRIEGWIVHQTSAGTGKVKLSIQALFTLIYIPLLHSAMLKVKAS